MRRTAQRFASRPVCFHRVHSLRRTAVSRPSRTRLRRGKLLRFRQNPQRPVQPRRSRAIILYERNRPAIAKVYSEATSTQAVHRNGERLMRLPQCTVVSGQIDLNTGGARGRFCTQSDPDEKANPLQVAGLAKIKSKRSHGKWEEKANAQKALRKHIHLLE